MLLSHHYSKVKEVTDMEPDKEAASANGGREGEWEPAKKDTQRHKMTREEVEMEDEGELPQPLSLADLRTETCDDLTSITAITTNTSYFTQLTREDDSVAVRDQLPLHSTVALPNPAWNPPNTHDPHRGLHPVEGAGTGGTQLVLPSIREISRINAPSLNATDSGVAASSEFNPTRGASLEQLSASDKQGPVKQTGLEEGKESGRGEKEICGSHELKSVAFHPQQRNEADSGLVFSTPFQHTFSSERPTCREVTPVTRLPPSNPPRLVSTALSCQPLRTHGTTPSQHSSALLGGTRVGEPLVVSQKPGLTTRGLVHGDILPSQLKLPSPSPLSFSRSPGLTPASKTGVARTPNRYAGFQNWFSTCRSLTTHTGSTRTPGFPSDILRKKEVLKARLQFCSE